MLVWVIRRSSGIVKVRRCWWLCPLRSFLRRLNISFETRCIINTLVALFLNESEQAKHGLTIIAGFNCSISLALTLSASVPLPPMDPNYECHVFIIFSVKMNAQIIKR